MKAKLIICLTGIFLFSSSLAAVRSAARIVWYSYSFAGSSALQLVTPITWVTTSIPPISASAGAAIGFAFRLSNGGLWTFGKDRPYEWTDNAGWSPYLPPGFGATSYSQFNIPPTTDQNFIWAGHSRKFPNGAVTSFTGPGDLNADSQGCIAVYPVISVGGRILMAGFNGYYDGICSVNHRVAYVTEYGSDGTVLFTQDFTNCPAANGSTFPLYSLIPDSDGKHIYFVCGSSAPSTPNSHIYRLAIDGLTVQASASMSNTRPYIGVENNNVVYVGDISNGKLSQLNATTLAALGPEIAIGMVAGDWPGGAGDPDHQEEPIAVSGDGTLLYLGCTEENIEPCPDLYTLVTPSASALPPATIPGPGFGGVVSTLTLGPLDLPDEDLSVPENHSLTIPGDAGNPCGGAVTYSLVDQPEHGTVQFDSNGATYTPGAGYTGRDVFTWRATAPGCGAADNPNQPQGRIAIATISVDAATTARSMTLASSSGSSSIPVQTGGIGPFTLDANSNNSSVLRVLRTSCPAVAENGKCSVIVQGVGAGSATLTFAATDNLGYPLTPISTDVTVSSAGGGGTGGGSSGGGGGSGGGGAIGPLVVLLLMLLVVVSLGGRIAWRFYNRRPLGADEREKLIRQLIYDARTGKNKWLRQQLLQHTIVQELHDSLCEANKKCERIRQAFSDGRPSDSSQSGLFLAYMPDRQLRNYAALGQFYRPRRWIWRAAVNEESEHPDILRVIIEPRWFL